MIRRTSFLALLRNQRLRLIDEFVEELFVARDMSCEQQRRCGIYVAVGTS